MEVNLLAARSHMAAVEFDLYYYKSEILPLAKMGENCWFHVKTFGIFA